MKIDECPIEINCGMFEIPSPDADENDIEHSVELAIRNGQSESAHVCYGIYQKETAQYIVNNICDGRNRFYVHWYNDDLDSNYGGNIVIQNCFVMPISGITGITMFSRYDNSN